MSNDRNDIIRAPILLSRHDVAVIHIFHKHDHLEDIWMSDVPRYYEEVHDNYAASAKQFVEQLEGAWCGAFMESLVKEIQARLT